LRAWASCARSSSTTGRSCSPGCCSASGKRDRLGLKFRFPAAHPFNPLRLAIAAGSTLAAAAGVFGVPSFEADGEIFWGVDSVDFLKAFLADQSSLRNAEMKRLDALPVGAGRRA
jgi:hypothetical protein